MDAFDYMTNNFFVPYRLITGGNALNYDQAKRRLYLKESTKYEPCAICPINETIELENENKVWKQTKKNSRSIKRKKEVKIVVIAPAVDNSNYPNMNAFTNNIVATPEVIK